MKYKYRLNISYNRIFSCFMFGYHILLQYICGVKILQNDIQQWKRQSITKVES